MRIPIDRQSPVPVYRQIEQYLRENIRSGALAADTRLPATRQLAEELGVSRITVKNAYAELESDGLIGTREGSGTFVMASGALLGEGREDGIDWPLWQREARREGVFSRAVYRGPHPAAFRQPDPVIFTGVGDPRQFPVKDFHHALQRVLRQADSPQALNYGEFNAGYPPLRETIARVLASQGIQARPEHILVTAGSQQALALVCHTLLKPGDTILVESPTYNLALELFRSLDVKIVGVPVDENGMQVDLLEDLLQRHRPRLVYTIPNFQNPSGACMSGARRRRLVGLCDPYNAAILEDDYAGDLRYDGRAQPAVKALDPRGGVIYTGTFSKMLMPGLRMGFLVADGPIFHELLHAKWVNDLATSTLMQRALDEYVSVGRYQAHLRRTSRLNRIRRDAMLAAIRRCLPEGVQANTPQGGLFLWLRLPEGMSSQALWRLAVEEGVEFTPGSWFFPDPEEGERYLRLNFATCTPEEIEVGIRRLGSAMRKM